MSTKLRTDDWCAQDAMAGGITMESNSKTYIAKVYCINCGFSGEMGIPQGTRVQNHPCNICGCDDLGRIIDEKEEQQQK